MPQFGVLQLAAEVGRAPVAAVAHLAGHAVVDVEALGEFLAADGSHEKDGFHAQGGKCLQRGLALASDDHQCGGVPQRTEDEVGIEGEAADVACWLNISLTVRSLAVSCSSMKASPAAKNQSSNSSKVIW